MRSMNNNMFADVAYIDIAKSFDKVSHIIYIILVYVGMYIPGLNHISKIGYKELRLMTNIVILLM